METTVFVLCHSCRATHKPSAAKKKEKDRERRSETMEVGEKSKNYMSKHEQRGKKKWKQMNKQRERRGKQERQ